jgi:hypothetical protein
MANRNIVVYTAIFNDYDVLLQPQIDQHNVDFVCFTDDPNTVRGVWEPRLVSEYDISPKLMSGKVKLLPHQHFPEYDYSVWVDGRMQIIGDIRDIIERSLDKSNMAVSSHPRRDCIYKEADACVDQNRADPNAIQSQMERYRNRGFPKNYGLSETMVLIRQHNREDVVRAMETWWDEYRNGAERDQLSFEFAAWKCGFEYERLHMDYYDKGGYFYLQSHKPPGLRGDAWEVLLRGREDNSGHEAKLFGLALTFMNYSERAVHIYKEEGLTALLKSVAGFIVRTERSQ